MYTPNKNVDNFYYRYGQTGLEVLEVYNEVDPLRCYFGPDVNPDEYVGYASRFLDFIGEGETVMYDATLASFHTSQLGSFVEWKDIYRIAARLSVLEVK